MKAGAVKAASGDPSCCPRFTEQRVVTSMKVGHPGTPDSAMEYLLVLGNTADLVLLLAVICSYL